MALFLTSLRFDGLTTWLDVHASGGPVVIISNASRDLADGGGIVNLAATALAAANRTAVPLDVRDGDLALLAAAGAILMTGGDPFALLTALRDTGADALLRDAHHRGIPIVGQSAGAMVCGPSLEPARITSPFAAPPGLDLSGLSLTGQLVLPHHDQPGRADLHRQAARAFATTALTPLWDDEALLTDGRTWAITSGRRLTRVATAADAVAVAEVFHAAARAAWATFLGAARLTAAPLDVVGWTTRIEQGAAGFLIAEDALGVSGFILHRPARDADLQTASGEVDLLYTHPRVWGDGTGRRLLERATWELLCQGRHEAVLWTEHRNHRALAVYRANGWRLDGAVRERDYLGAPIRELRHRLDLTRYGGGR